MVEKIDLKLITENIKLLRETSETEINSATAIEQKNIIINEVRKNPTELLKELPQEQLINLAIPYLGSEDEIYKIGRNALETNDGLTIRRVAENMYEADSKFKKAAVMQSTSNLRESLEREVMRREKRNMEKNLEFDTKTGKIRTETATRFITEHAKTDNQILKIAFKYEATQQALAA